MFTKLRSKKKYWGWLIASPVSLYFTFAYAQNSQMHRVVKGETLSEIAERNFGNPVYGAKGSLKRILRLNNYLTEAHRIFPGQEVNLGPADRREIASLKDPESPSSAEVASPAKNPPAADVAEEEEIDHRISLSAGYALTTLPASDDSSGFRAKLYSSRDLALQAAWAQYWSESFSTSFDVKLRSVDFSPSTNSAKTLSPSNKSLVSFSLSATHALSPRFSLLYGAGYGSKIFLRGINTSTVSLDSVPVPFFKLGLEGQLLKKGSTSVGAKAEAEYLAAASTNGYDVKAGHRLGGSLFVARRWGEANSVRLDAGYRSESQDTSLAKQQEQSVFGTLTFSWPLFHGTGR